MLLVIKMFPNDADTLTLFFVGYLFRSIIDVYFVFALISKYRQTYNNHDLWKRKMILLFTLLPIFDLFSTLYQIPGIIGGSNQDMISMMLSLFVSTLWRLAALLLVRRSLLKNNPDWVMKRYGI